MYWFSGSAQSRSVLGSPRAMREQIAHGELARRVRVVQLEIREVVDDAIVPLELPLVHEHCERRRPSSPWWSIRWRSACARWRARACPSPSPRSPSRTRASRPARWRSPCPAPSSRAPPSRRTCRTRRSRALSARRGSRGSATLASYYSKETAEPRAHAQWRLPVRDIVHDSHCVTRSMGAGPGYERDRVLLQAS